MMNQDHLTMFVGVLHHCFPTCLCLSECQLFESERCWQDGSEKCTFLQHTSPFKLCTSCSPHSCEIICLLGLLWTVVFSLSISLGVRPNENQEGEKKFVRSGWSVTTEAAGTWLKQFHGALQVFQKWVFVLSGRPAHWIESQIWFCHGTIQSLQHDF